MSIYFHILTQIKPQLKVIELVKITVKNGRF